MKYRILAALLVLLFPAAASAAWLGGWQCLWGNDCNGVDQNAPLQAGPQAGGGLYEDASLELMYDDLWHTYCNDFDSVYSFTDAFDWVYTDIGTGTALLSDDVFPTYLELNPGATADTDWSQIQFTAANGSGEFVDPTAGRTVIFHADVMLGDWDAHHFFFGIANTASPVITAAGAWGTLTDAVGFYYDADAADGVIFCAYEGSDNTGKVDADENATAATLTDGTYYDFGIRIEGVDTIEWYLDEVKVCSQTLAGADELDGNMALVFFIGNGDGSADVPMRIDHLDISIER